MVTWKQKIEADTRRVMDNPRYIGNIADKAEKKKAAEKGKGKRKAKGK